MPTEILEGLPTVLAWLFRKTAKNDHYSEPAAFKWNRIPIETDNRIIGEEWETAGWDQAVQNGFVTSQEHIKWPRQEIQLSPESDQTTQLQSEIARENSGEDNPIKREQIPESTSGILILKSFRSQRRK